MRRRTGAAIMRPMTGHDLSIPTAAQAVGAPAGAGTAVPAPSPRLVSLDALRGWDMFWIIGADQVIRAFCDKSDKPALQFLSAQFEHVEWEGCHFYDLIFPLFLFMIGVSIPYAFTKRLAAGESKRSLYSHS